MSDDTKPTPNLGERPTIVEETPDLSKVLYSITTHLEDSRKSNEAVSEKIDTLAATVATVDYRLERLEKQVFGESGRPPPNESDPGAPPEPLDAIVVKGRELARQADARATGNAHEMAALEGRMIAGFATMKDEIASQSNAVKEELKGELEKQSQELAKQSTKLGIDVRGLRWLSTSDARHTFIAIATTVALGWVAFRGTLVEHAIQSLPDTTASAAERAPINSGAAGANRDARPLPLPSASGEARDGLGTTPTALPPPDAGDASDE